ncbi:MAG: hypothetical protein JXB38_19890 [Anaerolineales bacterium]|nr:hypothetical protein [Anaerolineales bacterium]
MTEQLQDRLWKTLLLLGILIGAGVHLAGIPSYEVDFDKAQGFYLGLDFVKHGIFPIHGIMNSQGAFNPPFFVWLYLPGMALTLNPAWFQIIPALALHLIAMLLLYRIGKRYFDIPMGVVAVYFYAFSRWGFYFGHTSWAQGLLPPVFVIMLFSFFEWIEGKKPWHLTGLLVIAAFIPGVHWGGIVLFGVVVLLALIYRPPVKLAPLLVGVVLAGVMWLPFLKFETTRDFIDLQVLLTGELPTVDPGTLSALCVTESVADTGGGGLQDQVSDYLQAHAPFLYPIVERGFWFVVGMVRSLESNFYWSLTRGASTSIFRRGLYFVEVAAFAWGLGVLLYRLYKRQSTRPEQLLLLGYLLPAALQNVTPHHTSFRPSISWMFYGAQMLVIAYGLTVPKWTKQKYVRWALLAGLLALLVQGTGQLVNTTQRFATAEYPNPQRAVWDWIAADLEAQGKTAAAMRYDHLHTYPEDCWIVANGSLVNYDRYYVGVEHDYLLESLYGIHNTAKTPDGQVEKPDYILIYSRSLPQYEPLDSQYIVVTFDKYSILKPMQ